ncbi:hypothetical protein Ahy_A04g021372 [Arachis hypogaea]|uniref:SWIM-type domain-containing protein n=1 Tax=Arachis hypogaea TaxID=3818 RepID=A0A445DKL0_ARAHY|nr:hypothetical protein Ahy_A04g021372 [Arachis hypogaea]
MGGVGTKEVGKIAYRFLYVVPNGGFTNRLFWIDGDQYVRVMFDVHARLMPHRMMELYAVVRDVIAGDGLSPLGPEVVPLEATPIHYAQPHDSADDSDGESDSTYVAGSESSIDTVSEDEFVPETPSGSVGRFLLPLPLAIPRLSDVPSLYQTLNLDAMHSDDLLNAGDGEDYNTDGRYVGSVDRIPVCWQRLLAAIDKNRESLPMLRVTHCDRRASAFSVEDMELVDGWSQTSYRVRLFERTCDYGLFQSLHYPCRHVLAACAAVSIKWGHFVDPVYTMVRCTLEAQPSHEQEGIR